VSQGTSLRAQSTLPAKGYSTPPWTAGLVAGRPHDTSVHAPRVAAWVGPDLFRGGVPCLSSAPLPKWTPARTAAVGNVLAWRGVARAAPSASYFAQTAVALRRGAGAPPRACDRAFVVVRGKRITPFLSVAALPSPSPPSSGAMASMSCTPPRRVSRARHGVASSGTLSRLNAAVPRRRDPASGATTLHRAPRPCIGRHVPLAPRLCAHQVSVLAEGGGPPCAARPVPARRTASLLVGVIHVVHSCPRGCPACVAPAPAAMAEGENHTRAVRPSARRLVGGGNGLERRLGPLRVVY